MVPALAINRGVSAERDFLPAAVELQVSSPSPLGRAILWTILALLVTSATWACLAPIDIVTTAPGTVIPTGRVKPVQSYERGVVGQILVQEGDTVSKGDRLITLDATETQADLELVDQEIEVAHTDITRLQLLGSQVNRWSTDSVSAHIDDASQDSGSIGRSEDALPRKQLDEYQAALEELASERARLVAERYRAEAATKRLEALLPIVSQRADSVKALLERRQASQFDWLELELQRVDIQQQLIEADAEVTAHDAALSKTSRTRQRLIATWLRELDDHLTDATQRLASLEQRRIQAVKRLDRLVILAPESGIVEQLQVHHVGAIVNPAQPLLEIVPDDVPPVIEARVNNRDIGTLDTGIPATVKVDAYPFNRYGYLDGKLTSLSSDAVPDEQGNLHYIARVVPSTRTDAIIGTETLRPGMTTAVEFRTGERKVIEFLLDPVLRALKEAGRER